MGEAVPLQREKFFRPKGKQNGEGGERFLGILKKAIRISFRLLLLSLFFFIGHWVYVHLLEDPFFRVREIKWEGCRKIKQEALLSLIKIEGMPNLFTIRLKDLAKRLENHPWIDQIQMRKVFPNQILIQVEERKPIAILHLEELYYIDTTGVIFSPVGERDEYNYPFLTGLSRQVLEKDPLEAKRFVMIALELLRITDQEKAPPLEEISEIQMEKNFGIQCYSKVEGVVVRMGWEHFGEKLKRLSIVWKDLQRRGFTPTLIDCSDMRRMVVKKVSRREK